jgi:hypothetical protein
MLDRQAVRRPSTHFVGHRRGDTGNDSLCRLESLALLPVLGQALSDGLGLANIQPRAGKDAWVRVGFRGSCGRCPCGLQD